MANLRMRIFEGSVNAPNGATINVGRVGIQEDGVRWNTLPVPVSLLQLGQGWQSGAGGHRNWMDIGTFTTAGSDFMYYGLKHEFNGQNEIHNYSDHMDGVIGWGDNTAIPDNLNDLRFIFTTPTVLGGLSSSQDGLETMRLSWNGNVGIGNFYIPGQPVATNSIRPARRLEVLDGGLSLPQLRLTFTQQNGVNTGIFTDIQTMANGDLFINPRNAANNRNVGINKSNPQNTLEIQNGTTGNSGLRFTNLTSSFTPTFASYGKVLTVDGSGNVVLTDDQGSAGAGVTNAQNGLS